MTSTYGSKRAVLYARVSTDEQARSGYSLAQQIEALRVYAAREGYEVLEEITDPGQSGASLERPGMDRVRDLVAVGGVSAVLAQDRDRFSREPAYTYLLKREFEEHGTALRGLNDSGDNSPEGQLTDGILDQLAKFERAKTAERTRRGKNRKAKEGKVVAASRPIYGFKLNSSRDGYEINEETMSVVRRMFRMLAVEGESLNGVKKTFTREGILTPSQSLWNSENCRGNRIVSGQWNNKTIKEMVVQDAYRPHTVEEIRPLVTEAVARSLDPEKAYGISWWGRKRIITKQVAYTKPDGTRGYRRRQLVTHKPKSEWTAIPIVNSEIPREWIDAARERVHSYTKPSVAGNRHWGLSGGMFVCGCCGWVMICDRRRRNHNGTYYHYYRCNRKKYYGSSACALPKSFPAKKAEEMVWSWVSDLLSDPERLRAGLNELVEEERKNSRGNPQEQLTILLERTASFDVQRTRAQDLAVEGLLSPEELRSRLAGLEESRASLELEIESLRESEKRLLSLEQDAETILEQYVEVVPEALATLTPEERHRIYGMLRLQITANPDGTLSAKGVLSADSLCRIEDGPESE